MEYVFKAFTKKFKKKVEAEFFIKLLSTAIILFCLFSTWQMHSATDVVIKNMALKSYLLCCVGYPILIAIHFGEKKWSLLSKAL